jgi:phosphoenolpyruvate-protein kinase (PTS system EI component)
VATESKKKTIANLNEVTSEARRTFRNKKREYLKERNNDLSDSHNIFNRRKKYISQLLNAQGVNDFRQRCIQLMH